MSLKKILNDKRKLLRIASTLLILVGIGVSIFPIVDYVRMQYYRQKLIAAYENQFELDVDRGEQPSSFFENMAERGDIEEPSSLPESPQGTGAEGVSQVEIAQMPAVPTTTQAYSEELYVIGTIEIPKIDVYMPVLGNSTNYAMDFGAIHVAGTSGIGEVGNCGIAAHRGRSKTYFFNRLNELTNGDEIIINYGGVTYEYTVYETKVVEPHQSEVLNRSRTEKVLTLITCEPPGTDHFRLIIHALQKPN